MHPGVAGEIIPQSICTRHGLRVGANCIWVVKVFMCVPLHCLLYHHLPTTLDGTVHKLSGRNSKLQILGVPLSLRRQGRVLRDCMQKLNLLVILPFC